MIKFKTVRFKNFLSTGNAFTEIKLEANPITLIIGENGAGKSTFLDAITFALFGKPFRNINKPQLINSINEKDCLVEIEFTISDKHYLVRRGIKPNILEIYCNKSLLNQDAKSKDYQDQLEKLILKMNYKSFTQIVILGSTNFTPFMQLSAADRRSVIEDLLDIQIFSLMNSVVKTKIVEFKEKSNELRLLISSCKEKMQMHKLHLEEIKKNNADILDAKRKEISDNQGTLSDLLLDQETLSETITKLQERLVDQDSTNKKKQKIQILEAKIENNIDKVKKDIEFFVKNDTCPTCEQTINNKESKVHECNDKISTLQNGLEKLKLEESAVLQIILKLQKINEELLEVRNRLLENSTKSVQISNYISRLSRELVELEQKPAMSETFKAKSKELIASLQENSDKYKQCLVDLQHYDLVSTMLKDGGIKSKIIKQYIPIINKQVNKYLAAMNFFVNFNMDEEFKESIKSRHRDSFSYENFSEGEKRRIDLALLFTWRAIAKMKNSVHTNLLIFDEVFDGSLDANGTEEFMKLLDICGENTNIFVISHKGDILADKFRDIIKFKKAQNFSQMVQ
jgi:DNA repair exonuclease SbcCD ATPase subunit